MSNVGRVAPVGVTVVSWTIRACGILFSLIAFVAAWNGFAENRRFSNHGQRVLVEPIEKYTETTTTKKKLGVTVGESKSQSAQMFFTTLDKRPDCSQPKPAERSTQCIQVGCRCLHRILA